MTLSLCLPFYRNPAMLSEQYRVLASYADAVKAQIEIVLVDDGSPEPAVDVPRPAGVPPLRIYRVLEDRPWHQHAARNLAASEAAGPWLLLTDIDHVLSAESAAALLKHLHHDVVYVFPRVHARDGSPKLTSTGRPHAHINSFALTKRRFWAIGGYDEDLVGYGTDGFFRQRVNAAIRPVPLSDVTLIRYSPDVIGDAITQRDGLSAKAYRKASMNFPRNEALLAEKARTGKGPSVLAFEWERVL